MDHLAALTKQQRVDKRTREKQILILGRPRLPTCWAYGSDRPLLFRTNQGPSGTQVPFFGLYGQESMIIVSYSDFAVMEVQSRGDGPWAATAPSCRLWHGNSSVSAVGRLRDLASDLSSSPAS